MPKEKKGLFFSQQKTFLLPGGGEGLVQPRDVLLHHFCQGQNRFLPACEVSRPDRQSCTLAFTAQEHIQIGEGCSVNSQVFLRALPAAAVRVFRTGLSCIVEAESAVKITSLKTV